jgi:hypothetical protein
LSEIGILVTRKNKMQFIGRLAVFLGLCCSCSFGAFAQPVAMVTDLVGKAQLQDDAQNTNVSILAEIDFDRQIRLEKDTTLVAIYLKSGNEYSFRGPGLIQFKAEAPVALSGAAPQQRAPAFTKDPQIRIKPVGIVQGALVMRSARASARLKLLSPNGAKILELNPAFRWQGIENISTYRFELTDDAGKTLFETSVEGTALNLPPQVSLKEGATYTWEVSARTADGRKYSSAGDFGVAPGELRARIESVRPRKDSQLSERVAFAAWLEQLELKEEARKYWKELSAERPEDARLKTLAAE